MIPRIIGVEFRRAIKTMMVSVNLNAHAKGFYDEPEPIGTRIALLHSEASELLEHYRKGKESQPCDKLPSISNAQEELADLVIRCMDLAQEEQIDLAGAIIAKHEFNTGRPHMHGKKF